MFRNTVVKAGLSAMLFCAIVATADAALVYDFDDGTPQGWTTILNDPGYQEFSPSNATGGGRPGATSGSYRMLPNPFGNRDNNHDTMLVRSPEVFLIEVGDLTIDLSGGQGAGTSQATLPGSSSDLATDTASAGIHAMGVGLRRVSDDTYVFTMQKAGNGTGYETLTISQAALAPLGVGPYTIDVYDSYAGGWGWIAFDTVTIPGDTVIPEPSTFLIWAFGLLGLAVYARRRRTK